MPTNEAPRNFALESLDRKNRRHRPKKRGNGCSHCGKEDHEFMELERENTLKCTAYGRTCRKCNMRNHYSFLCRSRRRENKKEKENKEEEEEEEDDKEELL